MAVRDVGVDRVDRVDIVDGGHCGRCGPHPALDCVIQQEKTKGTITTGDGCATHKPHPAFRHCHSPLTRTLPPVPCTLPPAPTLHPCTLHPVPAPALPLHPHPAPCTLHPALHPLGEIMNSDT